MAKALWRTGVLDGVLRMRKALRLPVLTVLTYHHVEEPTADSPFDRGVADATPDQFRRHMELVARHATPLTIGDVVAIVRDGAPPPPNPVLVTFDDGYRSCLEVAAPILNRVGVPATFFIATRFIEERRLFWWERVSLILTRTRRTSTVSLAGGRLRVELGSSQVLGALTRYIKDTHGLDIEAFLTELAAAAEVEWTLDEERRLADQLIMSWDEVRALAACGMDIESHTRSHRVLQTVPFPELDDELAGSRRDLEHQLQRPVRAVAYPVGRPIGDRAGLHSAVRDAGYLIGFSNATGTNAILPPPLHRLRAPDPFALQRLAMGRDFSDAMFLGQLALPQLAYPAQHSRA